MSLCIERTSLAQFTGSLYLKQCLQPRALVVDFLLCIRYNVNQEKSSFSLQKSTAMPRKDAFHDTLKTALIKDGWTITHDPLLLKFGEQDVYIDLGAEAPLAAEKAGRKIAVEIKSFLGKSSITELVRAIGQYILYRSLLRREEVDRSLFSTRRSL